MPQTIAKNSWKYNPRLQPSENYLRTKSTDIIWKNNVIEKESGLGTEEIENTKIKSRNTHKWKIFQTTEENVDLKSISDNLPNISGKCISIVTAERQKPNVVFLRSKSISVGHNAYDSDDNDRKAKPRLRAQTGNVRRFRQDSSKATAKFGMNKDSILDQFNPTKFNPRRVKSSIPFQSKPKIPSDGVQIVIDLRKGSYRPYTSGSFRNVAEAQARTKSQLSILHNERFNPNRLNAQQRNTIIHESHENSEKLKSRVKRFCESIEQFKRETILACEYLEDDPNIIAYDNALEKLLKRLDTS